MKKNLLPILSLLFIMLNFSVYAQLAGTYGIPADFPTIEKAIDSLNQVGVGGNVTFNVAAGHTETFSKLTAGLLTATGYPDSQIVFQKFGGSPNPKITAALGGISFNRDGIIVIAGGDYITFDGIDIEENSLNTNRQNKMEWGYALVKASKTGQANGCRFVTIKNSSISLTVDSAVTGIYANNHTADTNTTVALHDTLGSTILDVMSNCKFFSNTISNVLYGFRISAHTSPSFYDQNNEIGVDGGNIINNYGGGALAAYGISAERQNNFKVANNSINGGSLTHTTSLYGISLPFSTNANVDIYENTITLTSGGTSSIMYALSNTMGSSGVDNTVNIYNNTIENCTQPSANGNAMWAIYNLAGGYNVNIYGNIVRNNSRPGTSSSTTVYGINNSGGTNVQIYDNEIYNNQCGYSIHGIYSDEGTYQHIYNNKIYDLRTTSSDSSAFSAGVTIISGPINTYIYNNFISDIKAANSSSRNGVRGINITNTTANTNIGLYYNTIYLNATSGSAKFGTSGIYHTYNATATSGALDMRNNIVVNNSTPNGIGRTAAFRRSAATNLNNYSTTSNNNLFYSGVGAGRIIYYDGTNEDQTLVAFKERVSPREGCSVTENVPFVNSTTAPYDLHVSSVSTQVEGSGQPISTPLAINSDFDSDSRHATKPDIGADEFSGTPLDITPPSISYTLFVDTISTSNRYLLGVTIEDCFSGVDVTALPRIYYKKYSDANTYVDNTSSTNGWKYTETTSGASPFDFTINYSLLYGGSAQSGDTIQYFVVAEDLASTPNVGIRQGTFSATPSSVNLTSAAFPITGSINIYKIQRLINGTVTVGTGGDYLTLTGEKGLFVSINENFLSGNTTAQIISNITEPGTYALNQWNEPSKVNYTLTIQPDAAVLRTLSGSYAGGLIRFNGADKVTVDGRFNGSGNYLAFENSSTSNNSAVIQLISLGIGAGVTDITIRNSNIKAGTSTASNAGYGIYIGGTSLTSSGSGADNNNITISYNNVSKGYYGVYARGTSANPMNNFILSDNTIGSNVATDYVTGYGLNLQAAVAPQITGNHVYNIIYDGIRHGLYFGSDITNAKVSKNDIHSFSQPTSTSAFTTVGIIFSSSTGCSNNQIDNNMIYDIKVYGSTTVVLMGIRIVGGSNYKVYHNTVNLTGAYTGVAANYASACLHILTTGTSNIDVRDNIFANTMSGTTPKNYLIHSVNTTTFSQLDYNDYWNTGSVFGYFGADKATFAIWKTDVGKDLNSKNVAVTFVSATDAHLSGSSIGDYNLRGTPLAGVTTDIDGDARSAIFPYMGADERPEALLYCSLGITALIEGFYDGSNMVQDTVTAELHNASSPYALVDQAKVVLNSSGNATANFFTAVDATNYYVVVKHRNSIETWSKTAQSFSGGTLNYDFTTAATQAYGDNLKLKLGKYCIFSGDVNQDGNVDLTDLVIVDNDNANFVTGYVPSDVNGDDNSDLTDMIIVDNNNAAFVTKIVPPGALATRKVRTPIQSSDNNLK